MADNTECAEYLIGKGADVNCRTNAGETPVMTAVRKGKVDLVRFFAERGADFHAADSDG